MIRNATLDDITELLAMLYVDGGTDVPSHTWMDLDAGKISTALTWLITKSNPMVYVFLNEKDRIIGFIAGEITEAWLGHALFTTDYALYVRSDYRHKRIAFKLLNHFIEQSIELGAERIMTTMPLENFNCNSMEKLLERKGFTITSKTYTREV
jgi:GNAT superfamily N-acetyltransferase